MGIKFSYTAPGTPQQNDHVEQNFTTLFNRVHVMLNGGKISSFLRNRLWAEAANTIILLEPHSHEIFKPILMICWEEKEKYPNFAEKMVKYVSPHTMATHNRLSEPIRNSEF